MTHSRNPTDYSEAETARRRDAIVKNMIATPPQKHEPLKAKKRLSRRNKKRAKS
jgi:hypothetical protein